MLDIFNAEILVYLPGDVLETLGKLTSDWVYCVKCHHPTFETPVKYTDLHEKTCLWKFIQICPRCNHHSNIAKLLLRNSVLVKCECHAH